MNEDSVKKFYEILLFNERKLKPLIQDVNFYYTLFDHDAIFMKMEFIWNVNKQRLTLNQAYEEEPQEKQSAFLAFLRKKGAYKKYLEECESYSESESDNSTSLEETPAKCKNERFNV
jgi:hypothetical protein